ncbi:hypothetical protein K227x_63480 [Rubripirellula lacrimiformis]|uniref:GNT-I family protein n=1 Tax=Rubripirellula lacrimiformis TaxID=1930273 RepID=A0A517NLG0_9BACT|nr:glycosyltransferase family 2 protein [Rubripirellula lacrimiformis]QDT07919.1 hypothetical protein K227x_63480 [Rubripirellula lacrimiformis]
MFDVPIAFVTFNRPDSARATFQCIQRLQPRTLFLISDGPRADRDGEAERVAQTRQVTDQIDWDCDVTRIYADDNLGCGRRISSGITQALQSVERLIVMEDDCVADASFFPFCQSVLDRYADDERVMAVSGNNFQQGRRRGDASYYFSKYPHCWGWATWRRAWQQFDLGIPDWPAFRDAGGLRSVCSSQREIQYWTEIFDKVHQGQSQSWAFPWTLATWMNHGLTVLPQVNLVRNTGFGEDATHTRKSNSTSNLPTCSIDQIQHPGWIVQDVDADQFTDNLVFSGTGGHGPLKRMERGFRKLRKSIRSKLS